MISDYSVRDEYVGRHTVLMETAEKLRIHFESLTSGLPRIDSITSRAKDPDRYFAKATKINQDGTAKYDNPRYGIQDQIGVRINVLYLSDVEVVRLKIIDFLRYIEEAPKFPDDDAAFGYFGHHFIFQMPDDVISDEDKNSIPEFFELQIKTLFQHAWSETHHDLGYKTPRKLTSNERRQIAFTAAQAWGADKIFEELSQSIVVNDNGSA